MIYVDDIVDEGLCKWKYLGFNRRPRVRPYSRDLQAAGQDVGERSRSL